MKEYKIYVACLGAYNDGTIYGDWIDATQDIDSIYEQIFTMLANSPVKNADEYEIHAFEGFGDIKLSQHTSIETANEIALFLQENDEVGEAILSYTNGDIDEAHRMLDALMGEFESAADYAREITEECSEIPEHLKYYIDYEHMAQDMELGGDIFTIEHGNNVLIFNNY